MFSNHTPALVEYSSRINRFPYLRNKGNHMGQIKYVKKEGTVQSRGL